MKIILRNNKKVKKILILTYDIHVYMCMYAFS